MTEAEAGKIRSGFSNGFEYPFGGGKQEKCDMDEVERHAGLLNDALNKQIPRKPIKDKKQGIRYTDTYSCPSCGQGFSGTGIAAYCYHCGQRLDWDSLDDLPRQLGGISDGA